VTDILALDVATTTGWARGCPGEIPTSGSVTFAKSTGASDNAVFGNALRWLSAFLEPQPRPAMLIMESMLPPGAMQGETSRAVRDRLAGLHGIFRAVAHLRGIYDISTVAVGDVRGHFIHNRTCKREIAKRWTIEHCRQLGWTVVDDNAADALATWHFAASLIKPELAIETSPLFNRRLTA
jgi:hypothetical protein